MAAPRFPISATADGVLTTFALGFPVIHENHIRVIKNGVLMVKGTDYAVQDPSATKVGGWPKIKFLGAVPTNGHVIKMYRNTPLAAESVTMEMGPRTALYALYRKEELENDMRLLVGFAAGGDIGQVALLAPTAVSFVAPCDGYLEELDTLVTKAVTTGGTLTVAVDGVAVTGMVATIANSAAVGANQRVAPSVAQSTTTKVRRGQTITVTPASFATAGDVRVGLELQPADF